MLHNGFHYVSEVSIDLEISESFKIKDDKKIYNLINNNIHELSPVFFS